MEKGLGKKGIWSELERLSHEGKLKDVYNLLERIDSLGVEKAEGVLLSAINTFPGNLSRKELLGEKSILKRLSENYPIEVIAAYVRLGETNDLNEAVSLIAKLEKQLEKSGLVASCLEALKKLEGRNTCVLEGLAAIFRVPSVEIWISERPDLLATFIEVLASDAENLSMETVSFVSELYLTGFPPIFENDFLGCFGEHFSDKCLSTEESFGLQCFEAMPESNLKKKLAEGLVAAMLIDGKYRKAVTYAKALLSQEEIDRVFVGFIERQSDPGMDTCKGICLCLEIVSSAPKNFEEVLKRLKRGNIDFLGHLPRWHFSWTGKRNDLWQAYKVDPGYYNPNLLRALSPYLSPLEKNMVFSNVAHRMVSSEDRLSSNAFKDCCDLIAEIAEPEVRQSILSLMASQGGRENVYSRANAAYARLRSGSSENISKALEVFEGFGSGSGPDMLVATALVGMMRPEEWQLIESVEAKDGIVAIFLERGNITLAHEFSKATRGLGLKDDEAELFFSHRFDAVRDFNSIRDEVLVWLDENFEELGEKTIERIFSSFRNYLFRMKPEDILEVLDSLANYKRFMTEEKWRLLTPSLVDFCVNKCSSHDNSGYTKELTLRVYSL